jgi:ribonuclease HI
MRVEAWIDGACGPTNPGPYGAWGAVLVAGDVEKRSSGKVDEDRGWTTNQRAEIAAAIEALVRVNRPCEVVVFSDSQYLVNTMTRGWARRVNTDLWDRLDREIKKHNSVRFKWVRGHHGYPRNEIAHLLADEVLGAYAFQRPA